MVAVNTSAEPRLPLVTVLVITAAAAVYGFADGNHLFLYDRVRVLDGELWRIVTGHLAHFSWQHLGYNIVLFALTGVWLENRLRTQYYVWLLAVTGLVSGLYFLLLLPDMEQYGGLSGLVSANVVCLSLLEIRDNQRTRALWMAVLLLFAAKVGWEMLNKTTVFVPQGDAAFVVIPFVHVIGAVVALTLFYTSRKPGSKHKLK